MQVNQQVEHFPFQKLPVDMPGSWALNMTNKIKAGQWGSTSSLRPFDRDAKLELGGGGTYQEDMNEVAWAATKAMCERWASS